MVTHSKTKRTTGTLYLPSLKNSTYCNRRVSRTPMCRAHTKAQTIVQSITQYKAPVGWHFSAPSTIQPSKVPVGVYCYMCLCYIIMHFCSRPQRLLGRALHSQPIPMYNAWYLYLFHVRVVGNRSIIVTYLPPVCNRGSSCRSHGACGMRAERPDRVLGVFLVVSRTTANFR